MLSTPPGGLAEMGRAEGSTWQTFNLIILGTCYITKAIQMSKTDPDFKNVVRFGCGYSNLRKTP